MSWAPTRPWRGRLVAGAAVLALVAIPAAVGAAPATPPQVPPAQATPDGAALYGQNCASCHGPRGQGTQLGPALVGSGPASVDFQLSTGRMPLRGNPYQPRHQQPVFSPAEIDAIVGYVAGFGGDGPQVPSVRPGEVDMGRTLYAAHCAACHSATGRGAALSNGLVAPDLWQATPTQVGEAIRVGPGIMPAFPDSVLTSGDVDAIAGYIQVLQNQPRDLDRGGASLDRVGPFMEGAIAWLVGLLALVVVIRWLGSRAAR